MAKKQRRNHEGTVYRRPDGRWAGEYSVGYDHEGKRKRVTIYGSTKHEVEKKMFALRPAFVEGFDVDAGKIPFGQFLDRWLEYWFQVKFRENTYIAYKSLIDNHAKPYLGSVPLGKLTPIQMQTYMTALSHAGVSPWRQQRAYRVVHKALRDAVDWNLIYRFPMSGMREPKAMPTQKMQVFSRDQIRTYLQAAKGAKMETLFVLAMMTGMRQGELFGLFWDDISWDTRELSVKRACVEIRRVATIGEPKTESSKRVIHLPKVALDSLKAHREHMLATGYDIPLVFPNADGGLMTKPNFYVYHWKPFLLKAGLPLVRFHDIRHTHATLLLQHGIHVKVVQERLGHKNIETTLETYAHVLPSMQKEAAQKLDELFGGGTLTQQPRHDLHEEIGVAAGIAGDHASLHG